jgi:hypothetical protein
LAGGIDSFESIPGLLNSRLRNIAAVLVLYSCSGEGEIKAWELGPGGGATWLKTAVQTVRLKTAV